MLVFRPWLASLTLVATPLLFGCGTEERNQCPDGGCDTTADSGADADADACVPTSCSAQGKNCGTVDDGCGTQLDCGTCATGVCGATTPNVCGCVTDAQPLTTAPRTARRARSSGFTGTDAAYANLFTAACATSADCVDPCTAAGGTADMCGASECLPDFSGANACLPPPVWSNLQAIQLEATSVADTVQLVAISTPYHDVLLTDQFKLEVPDGAAVTGIVVEILKAGDTTIVDDSVRLMKGGVAGGAERASTQTWATDLTWVTYGGPEDLWGETWTAADLNADDFGVAVSTLYTQTAGNSRAYVSQVRVTVYYSPACSP